MINKVGISFLLAILSSVLFVQCTDAQSNQLPVTDKAKNSGQQHGPYNLASSLQLFDDGSNRGYLVVKVDIDQGSYIYSMSQKKPLQPTKIKVEPSKSFRLLGAFKSDRPAKVIEKDPVFEQRVEKHEGTIQFFAPIELAQGVDHKKLQAKVVFNGQVCSDMGCRPIQNVKSTASFAGYLKSPARQAAANAGQSDQASRR